MGSTMKETVFTKDVFEGLQGWRAKAARNAGKRSSTPTSEENSQQFGEDGSKKGASQGGSTEGSVPPEQSMMRRLPTTPREGAVGTDNHEDPDPSLKRMCQLMYGKQGGLEKIKAAAKVSPSYRQHTIVMLEEEEERRKD